MTDAPTFLKDAKSLLTDKGFAHSDIWYHGTSSALLVSIRGQGLKRSGDKAMNNAAKQTMATIGNNYTESIEPIFLTQSKELAFYWAEQSIRSRSARIEGQEQAVVLEVSLPEKVNAKVKPDVGAASLLLLEEGEQYMAYLAGIYQSNGFPVPDIDLIKADRLEYLNKLGMAYLDSDISLACVKELTG